MRGQVRERRMGKSCPSTGGSSVINGRQHCCLSHQLLCWSALKGAVGEHSGCKRQFLFLLLSTDGRDAPSTDCKPPMDVLDIWEVEKTLGNRNGVRWGGAVTPNTRPLLPRSLVSIDALRSVEQSARPGLRTTGKRRPSEMTGAIRDERQHIYCL